MALNRVRMIVAATLALVIVFTFASCGFIRKTIYPLKYRELIEQYGDKYDISYELLAAVIYTESGFDENAVSGVGAVGLMQLMPTTAEEIAWRLGEDYSTVNIKDPETNIAYGSFYLNYLYRYLGENWDTACAAYNAGIGKVSSWLKDSAYSDDGVSLKSIPIAETDNYIKRINKYKQKYKEIYFNSEEESYEQFKRNLDV